MLVLLDVRFAFMWGLLAFALNYIPNIGSVLAAIPPIPQVLVFGWSVRGVLVVLAGYLIANLVSGNILEPRIMGRGLGLPRRWCIPVLVFWGWLLGPVGMLPFGAVDDYRQNCPRADQRRRQSIALLSDVSKQ